MSDDELEIVVSHPTPKFEACVSKNAKTGLYGWSLTRYDYTPSESVRPCPIYTSGTEKNAQGVLIWAIFETYEAAYTACRKASEAHLIHFEWNPKNAKHIKWPPKKEPSKKPKRAA